MIHIENIPPICGSIFKGIPFPVIQQIPQTLFFSHSYFGIIVIFIIQVSSAQVKIVMANILVDTIQKSAKLVNSLLCLDATLEFC